VQNTAPADAPAAAPKTETPDATGNEAETPALAA
jgi:hypothetical protein